MENNDKKNIDSASRFKSALEAFEKISNEIFIQQEEAKKAEMLKEKEEMDRVMNSEKQMKTFIITIKGKDLDDVIDCIERAQIKILKGISSYYAYSKSSNEVDAEVGIESHGEYKEGEIAQSYYKGLVCYEKEKISLAKLYRSDYEPGDDGPYCSACQQTPCGCSDRERASNVHDF